MTLDALRAQATIEEGNFRAFTHMAVELEVAELLYALVRQTKPNLVVECGAGEGYSSAFIAQALQENGFGTLASFEQDSKYAEIAAARLRFLPGTVTRGFSHAYGAYPAADLVFIDTLGEHREQDMAYWFAHPGRPLIVIHDAAHYSPDTFAAGEGVLLGSGRGVWIGRGRPQHDPEAALLRERIRYQAAHRAMTDMRSALEHVISSAGHPDAAEGCRNVIKIARDALGAR